METAHNICGDIPDAPSKTLLKVTCSTLVTYSPPSSHHPSTSCQYRGENDAHKIWMDTNRIHTPRLLRVLLKAEQYTIARILVNINLLTPNVNYSGRTAPLTSKVAFDIFIQQIQVLNILNMVYTLRFFSSKCILFHNSNVFGSCIIHILYTGCAKIKKNNSGAKRLMKFFLLTTIKYLCRFKNYYS